MGSFLSRLFGRSRRRPLQALQIEVTSRCTRACAVCPRSALRDTWRDGDLDEGLWKVLEPDLGLAGHIHLQGWGEPLLHPALPRWARAARKAGCTVGITTNGDLLPEAEAWLQHGDVDLVTLSIAGDPRVHAELRDGSSLERVLEAAGRIARAARQGGPLVKVQASYLLTLRSAPVIASAVEAAAQAGIHGGVRALRELDAADEARSAALDARPFPDACAACPKKSGW